MSESATISANLNIQSLAQDESILSKIINKRQQRILEKSIDDKYQAVDIEEIKKSKRSLLTALTTSTTGLILECKKASPSKGILAENYQPDEIAKSYTPFATAISVLTEPDYFSGSLIDLEKVTKSVQQPVLCKDFIIDTSQIIEARKAGADIILLMLSVINDDFWKSSSVLAQMLGLDIITEVNNEQEVQRALLLNAKIIGINNRNLHSLKTDLNVTEKLVKLIPSDRFVIAESGISTQTDLHRLAPLVDGFLIGSSLMQSERIDLALRKLIFGEVKICGLTRRQDADLCWLAGASYGGMIFTSLSSRYLSLEQAQVICIDQPMPMVGVFMDQSINEIVEYAKTLNLFAVQLHGEESSSFLEQLRLALDTKCEIWKAISCSDSSTDYPTVTQALLQKKELLAGVVDKVLFDKPKDKKPHTFNRQILGVEQQLLIAGGLTLADPANDVKTHQSTFFAGFDLCSALESSAGIKDAEKITQLFDALKPRTAKHRTF